MKSICLAIVAVLAFVATEAAAASCRQMVCNNNPTCQALRNAGNCDAARAAGGTMPGASTATGRNCPAGTAWSNRNQQCSRHNWCWQRLGLPNSSQNPTGAALAKLEACKAKG
jgi:hypothetical protein